MDNQSLSQGVPPTSRRTINVLLLTEIIAVVLIIIVLCVFIFLNFSSRTQKNQPTNTAATPTIDARALPTTTNATANQVIKTFALSVLQPTFIPKVIDNLTFQENNAFLLSYWNFPMVSVVAQAKMDQQHVLYVRLIVTHIRKTTKSLTTDVATNVIYTYFKQNTFNTIACNNTTNTCEAFATTSAGKQGVAVITTKEGNPYVISCFVPPTSSIYATATSCLLP